MENQGQQSQHIQPQIPAQPASQSVSLEPKKSFPRKWPLIIIGIIMLIVLLTGTYILGKNQNVSQKLASNISQATPTASPIHNPTADWKIYTSKLVASLSFKYPSSWIAKQTDNANSESITLTSKNGTEITYATGGNYHGGACSDQATLTINQASLLPYAKGFSLVTLSMPANKNNTSTDVALEIVQGVPSIGVVKQCNYSSIFSSKSNPNQQIIFGTNKLIQADQEEASQILSTFKFTDQTSSQSPQTQAKFLEIPEFNVKVSLSSNIQDAYYLPATANKGYVYLKVHSLDSEPYCNDNSSLGVAALNRVGIDEIDQRTEKKFSDSGNGSTIGKYYFYIDLEQAVCSQNSANQTLETNARKAFGEASKTITAL